MSEPLPTLPVHALEEPPSHARWLVRELWGAGAVGVIGGAPKACKSWLALELAVAVASGTACLGRFEVDRPGPVVAYLAEDALPQIRHRVAQLCQHRGLALPGLELHVITAPSLRLDLGRDRRALEATLSALTPRLLLLDPLVRLHRLDENSATDVSGLLGFLRELNRRHELAVTLVHHTAKRSRRDPGQALRGSSDLHAWNDSACYLARRADGRLALTVQHRSAPAPEPLLLRLAGGGGDPLHLLVDPDAGADEAASLPLADAVRAELRNADRPLSRTALRQRLRVNNARLGHALHTLAERGLALRGPDGWSLPPETDPRQLSLAP